MRVTVIIPLFNKAPYLGRALSSVLTQSFADFEVLVVDDGSTDSGADIVETFDDSRVRVIRQANAGPGAARNRGIAEARGEFLAFLDADDEWLPDYLANSIGSLDKEPQAAAVTSGYFAFPGEESSEELWRSRRLSDGVVSLTPNTDPGLVVSLLAYMTPCTTVVRSETVRRLAGFYERERCAYGEDAHLFLKVLLNERVIVNLKPLVRIHFEASAATQTRRSVRPVEPFLIDPKEINASCPANLSELLERVLAIRALKTACMLGYWGNWREARDLVRRFRVSNAWRLPYYTSSLACRTPLGAAIGRLSRMLVAFHP